MGVHVVRAAKESLKVLVPDHKRDRQADRAPEAVAAADPVPEAEHVLLCDAECGDSLLIRAERDEVLRDMSGGAGAADGIEEPSAGTLSICDGLLGSEGLAGNDEEGALWVARAEGLREVGAVDVRDKVSREVALGVVAQGLGDHDGAKIGSTDADVDDGLDGLACIALPSAATDGVGELLDVLQHGRDLGNASLSRV